MWVPCSPARSVYSSLMNSLLALYTKRRPLKSGLPWLLNSSSSAAGGRGLREDADMQMEFDAKALWLIPAGLALWFMIWALWNWWREERR